MIFTAYDQIKDMLCDELEEIAKKKELTTNSLDVLYKGVDILKDISTIKAMEQEYPEEGYSRNSYDGYSGDTREELSRLMNQAQNEREREANRKAMDSMK